MNPGTEIDFPKNQYKKFIKDVVTGTLERSELIEEKIIQYLGKDIDLKKTDKLLKIILFAAVFELISSLLSNTLSITDFIFSISIIFPLIKLK